MQTLKRVQFEALVMVKKKSFRTKKKEKKEKRLKKSNIILFLYLVISLISALLQGASLTKEACVHSYF
jgi:cytoskeletal protein RodZ